MVVFYDGDRSINYVERRFRRIRQMAADMQDAHPEVVQEARADVQRRAEIVREETLRDAAAKQAASTRREARRAAADRATGSAVEQNASSPRQTGGRNHEFALFDTLPTAMRPNAAPGAASTRAPVQRNASSVRQTGSSDAELVVIDSPPIIQRSTTAQDIAVSPPVRTLQQNIRNVAGHSVTGSSPAVDPYALVTLHEVIMLDEVIYSRAQEIVRHVGRPISFIPQDDVGTNLVLEEQQLSNDESDQSELGIARGPVGFDRRSFGAVRDPVYTDIHLPSCGNWPPPDLPRFWRWNNGLNEWYDPTNPPPPIASNQTPAANQPANPANFIDLSSDSINESRTSIQISQPDIAPDLSSPAQGMASAKIQVQGVQGTGILHCGAQDDYSMHTALLDPTLQVSRDLAETLRDARVAEEAVGEM
jgi:hypothetical protein